MTTAGYVSINDPETIEGGKKQDTNQYISDTSGSFRERLRQLLEGQVGVRRVSNERRIAVRQADIIIAEFFTMSARASQLRKKNQNGFFSEGVGGGISPSPKLLPGAFACCA